MDIRTLKIRELRSKLTSARSIAIQCVEMEDGKHLSRGYWGKQAIHTLEETKE